MRTVRYSDLHEFGIDLIPFSDGETPAAKLVNNSGKAIVSLSYLWRYTTESGRAFTSYSSDLGSTQQIELLTGRASADGGPYGYIMPGSSRWINERGIFGDNTDVLPLDQTPGAGGFMFGGAHSSMRPSPLPVEEFAEIALVLDIAFLDDGSCIGPDERNLFEAVAKDLKQQRTLSLEASRSLRKGESVGRIFEQLRPWARRAVPPPPGYPVGMSLLLPSFVHYAIDRLINLDEHKLLVWFEQQAEAPRLKLHRVT